MSVSRPSWYDDHAADVVPIYEAADPAALHAWLDDLLPPSAGLVADISAGSGRDAAWFASRGHEVLAVEPSYAMREHGARLHSDSRIRWLSDGLPSLAATLRLGLAADVVHLGAVWQHVSPADRPRAFCSAWPPRPVTSGFAPAGVGSVGRQEYRRAGAG